MPIESSGPSKADFQWFIKQWQNFLHAGKNNYTIITSILDSLFQTTIICANHDAFFKARFFLALPAKKISPLWGAHHRTVGVTKQ